MYADAIVASIVTGQWHDDWQILLLPTNHRTLSAYIREAWVLENSNWVIPSLTIVIPSLLR